MTKLNKRVERLSEESIVRDAGKFKPLVVAFYPGGTLGLRPHKTRRPEFVLLSEVYAWAIKRRVQAEQKVKRASRTKR